MNQQTAVKWLCYFINHNSAKTESLSQLEELSNSDWDRLVQTSVDYDLSPLLYKRIKTLKTVPIPADILQKLKDKYLDSAASSMRLFYQIAKILKYLKDENIPVIVLKGAYLAGAIYGDTALRLMADVDLLVKKEDVAKIDKKFLEEMGFSSYYRNEWYKENSYHFRYSKKEIMVEIHWGLHRETEPVKINLAELWVRARPDTVAGVEVLALAPEDFLLHQCTHASYNHTFGFRLKPFCDIYETIRHYKDKLDWKELQVRSIEWKANRGVYLTLYLTKDILAADIPDEILDNLKPDSFDTRFITWGKERLLLNNVELPAIYQPFTELWTVNSIYKKAGLFLKNIFLPPKTMAKLYNLPDSSVWVYLYYPIRIKELIYKHGNTTWKLLRHNKEIIEVATYKKWESRNTIIKDWLWLSSNQHVFYPNTQTSPNPLEQIEQKPHGQAD